MKRAAEDRRVRPRGALSKPATLRRRTGYLALTVTLFVSVVGRPFVLRTILNVAFPLADVDIVIVTVLFAPALSFRPAALPEIPAPVNVAVAPTSAGHLARLGLVVIGDRVLLGAARVQPATLRSLDAIHLATALRLGDRLAAFVSYDERQLEAARALDLPVASPR